MYVITKISYTDTLYALSYFLIYLLIALQYKSALNFRLIYRIHFFRINIILIKKDRLLEYILEIIQC